MTVTLDRREDLNLANLARVALDGEPVAFSEAATRRMQKAHDDFQHFVDTHRHIFIYGVTSSYGPDAKKHQEPEKQRRNMARGNPFLGLSFGHGHVPDAVVRAMIFSTFSLFIEGTTATNPVRAREIAELLKGKLPKVPVQGVTGAGEILQLFHLYSDIPRREDLGYQAGSGNGSPGSTGWGALRAVLARRRLELATQVFALSVEGFNAPLEAYDPALKSLWGDVYEGEALDRLNALLEGAPKTGRRRYQAPVSWRILPRVLGQAYRALAALEETATASLQSLGSNPTFVPPNPKTKDGKTLSTGSYHNAILPPCLNAMAASWVDLATLAHRHSVKFHKGDVSLLPDRLLPPGTEVGQGMSTTYLEYVPNGFLEEMRMLAQPTLLSPQEPAASEQDDINANGSLAAMMEGRVADLFDMNLAVLAAIASQALHVTKRQAPPPLRRFLEFVRESFPPVVSTRKLGDDADKLSHSFGRAIERGTQGSPPRMPGGHA